MYKIKTTEFTSIFIQNMLFAKNILWKMNGNWLIHNIKYLLISENLSYVDEESFYNDYCKDYREIRFIDFLRIYEVSLPNFQLEITAENLKHLQVPLDTYRNRSFEFEELTIGSYILCHDCTLRNIYKENYPVILLEDFLNMFSKAPLKLHIVSPEIVTVKKRKVKEFDYNTYTLLLAGKLTTLSANVKITTCLVTNTITVHNAQSKLLSIEIVNGKIIIENNPIVIYDFKIKDTITIERNYVIIGKLHLALR